MKNKFFALTIVGGKGERLKPLTDDKPKPMVEINGIPIIAHQINWMKFQGVTDIIFLCGYKSELIFNYFGDGSKHGFKAHYSYEEKPLGRGGAIKKGFSMIPKSVERFLVTNGDVLTTQSLNPIIKMHSKNLSTATVMAVPYPSQYGIIESQENGLIKKFSEKSRIPFFINGGIYIFERSIYNLLPEIGDHEVSTFPKLVKDKKISAYYSNNFWTSIETYKDLQEVQEKFKTGKIKF